MRIVRSSFICFVLLAACSSKPETDATGSNAQAVTDSTLFHSSQNGGGAIGSVSKSDPNSFYSLNFSAWENQSGNSRTASLNFYGYGASWEQVCYSEQICSDWDYNTWSCTKWETVQYCYYQQSPIWIYGYGDIPTSDFRVGEHTAHLTTDLANDPGFQAQKCTWNGCTPLTGTIDVVWRDNGLMVSENQGSWSKTMAVPWGPFSERSSGRNRTASADVSGTIFGDSPDAFGGQINRNVGASVEKFFVQSGGGDGGAPDAGYPPPPPMP